MEVKLVKFVEEIFMRFKKNSETMEFKEELTNNLIEKYRDYIKDGLSEEDAYEKSIESLGDLEEVLGETPLAKDNDKSKVYSSFSFGDYKRIDLSELNLSGTKFNCSSLDESKFVNTIFDDCKFNFSGIQSSNFSKAKLNNCTFKASHLANSSFRSAEIKNNTFSAINLEKADFSEVEIADTKFSKCNFSETIFCSSMFKNIEFSTTNLEGCNFENSKIENVNFGFSNLKSCSFKNATIINVTAKCDLRKIDFSKLKIDRISYALFKANGAKLDDVEFVE